MRNIAPYFESTFITQDIFRPAISCLSLSLKIFTPHKLAYDIYFLVKEISVFLLKLCILYFIVILFIGCSDQGSNPVNKPDTTSHNFSIQKFEWGAKSSSVFLDIDIVEDSCAWAVGEIFLEDSYTFDSLGHWIEPYNAAYWNGNNWELKRIPILSVGTNETSHAQLEIIFAVSEDQIIFSDGGILIYFDGQKFTYDTRFNSKLTGGIRKIWASDLNNIFIVGTNGMIGHYNGQDWQFLDSGTEMWVMDIWGRYNDENAQYDIYCPVSIPLQADVPDILQINPDLTVISKNWPNQTSDVNSVWFEAPDKIIIAGSGVYTFDGDHTYSERFSEVPGIMLTRVRGNTDFDFFISGHFGLLMHYNGSTWMEYTDFNEIDHFWGLDVDNNITIAVGDGGIKAFIYVLRRN